MNHSSSTSAANSRAPAYIVLFFVVLTVLLAGFTTVAFRTAPGVVTDEAYEKGLAYNQTLQKAATASALGWRGTITAKAVDGGRRFLVTVADASGAMLRQATVRVFLVRPARAGMDAVVDATETSEGYVGTVVLPAAGIWQAHVSVSKNAQQFQFEKTLNLP